MFHFLLIGKLVIYSVFVSLVIQLLKSVGWCIYLSSDRKFLSIPHPGVCTQEYGLRGVFEATGQHESTIGIRAEVGIMIEVIVEVRVEVKVGVRIEI